MSDPELAEPSITLGKLQRGRGAGWIEAAHRADGKDLLMACLAVDPRWDAQVESRGSYYAELCMALTVPASDIDPAGLTDDRLRWLRFDVLAEMARRHDAQALAILLDSLRPGPDVDALVWDLERLPNGSGLVGLEDLIANRFGPEDLADLVVQHRSSLPWDSWAAGSPAIAGAIAAVDARSTPNRPLGVPPPALGSPLGVILAHDWGAAPPKALVHRLVHTATASEVDLLHRTALGPWSTARWLALRVLGERRDPFAVEVAAQTFSTNTIGRERGASYVYMCNLDAVVTLPIAREWILADDDRSEVAATLMAMHSERVDVPAIRAAFSRAWERDGNREMCSLVDALGRHPDDGPYPELRTVFTDISYSYARGRAARAMAAVDTDFPALFAHECLWDCESETRLVGVERASAEANETTGRLRQLARSDAEDDAVRDAATARLTPGM